MLTVKELGTEVSKERWDRSNVEVQVFDPATNTFHALEDQISNVNGKLTLTLQAEVKEDSDDVDTDPQPGV